MFTYKQREHIYFACLILWVLTTIIYLYLLASSSNYIIDFYWGYYNYYILLSILMFFILVISKNNFSRFKNIRTINKVIIISLVILILLNQSLRIYNSFISNQKIPITLVNSSKILKLENLEELDISSDNYNIIHNSYISKKSILIKDYYKTSELIVDKKTNKNYKLDIEYYELFNIRHAKKINIELKNLIIDKYIFERNPQLTNIYIKNYQFDNNIELFTFNDSSLNYKIHLYYHNNKVFYVIYNGNLTEEELIDKILSELKKTDI